MWSSYASSIVAWPLVSSKWRSLRHASWTSRSRMPRPCNGASKGPVRACSWLPQQHATGRRPVHCSSRGTKLGRCCTTSRTMVTGKPLWPCLTSSGTCTETSGPAETCGRPRRRAPTTHIAASRHATRTTCYTLRRMSPRLWPTRSILGRGLVPCADVCETLNTILKRAYNDHTRRGGEGTPGVAQVEMGPRWFC